MTRRPRYGEQKANVLQQIEKDASKRFWPSTTRWLRLLMELCRDGFVTKTERGWQLTGEGRELMNEIRAQRDTERAERGW